MEVSARFGFGDDVSTLSRDNAAKAKMWEMVSLAIAFAGSEFSKGACSCLTVSRAYLRFPSHDHPYTLYRSEKACEGARKGPNQGINNHCAVKLFIVMQGTPA